MSGFGGIGGVWTVFLIVTLEPDSSVLEYEAGSTPDPSAIPAVTPTATSAMLASRKIRARHPLLSFMVSPPVRHVVSVFPRGRPPGPLGLRRTIQGGVRMPVRAHLASSRGSVSTFGARTPSGATLAHNQPRVSRARRM